MKYKDGQSPKGTQTDCLIQSTNNIFWYLEQLILIMLRKQDLKVASSAYGIRRKMGSNDLGLRKQFSMEYIPKLTFLYSAIAS